MCGCTLSNVTDHLQRNTEQNKKHEDATAVIHSKPEHLLTLLIPESRNRKKIREGALYKVSLISLALHNLEKGLHYVLTQEIIRGTDILGKI